MCGNVFEDNNTCLWILLAIAAVLLFNCYCGNN